MNTIPIGLPPHRRFRNQYRYPIDTHLGLPPHRRLEILALLFLTA
ncbi:hypothetical protein [Gilliamella sp.]|nr:hypothetical protein [Gilliamella sp.]